MLYIKKQKPDKTILDEVAKIKSTPEWRATTCKETKKIRQYFDQLPKDKIRKKLLVEQHYLCIYCMKRIIDDPLEISIEHWYPLSKDKEMALDYGNMIGVCKGGSSVHMSAGERRELCCDAYKGENEITINPLNRRQMDKIKYTKAGIIYTGDSELDKDINDILRLNGTYNSDGSFKCDTSTGLLKGRRDAYERSVSIIKKLDRKGRLTSGMLKSVINSMKNKDVWDEFSGTIIFFLERKAKSLEGQGR